MFRPILKMELKRSLKGLIAWTVSIGLYIYLIIIIYPMVKDIYALVPEEMMAIMERFGGIPKDVLDYYSLEGGLLLNLFGAIFAAMLGFNSLHREEKDKTTDLLYTLPASKVKFFLIKLLSVFIQILIFSILIMAFSIIGFYSIDKGFNLKYFFTFTIFYTIMLIMISILGFSLASFMKSASKSSIALAIPLPLYIISIVSTLTENKILMKLKYLTPFTFSDPSAFIKSHESVELVSLIVYSLITLLLIVVSLFYFRKKEFIS